MSCKAKICWQVAHSSLSQFMSLPQQNKSAASPFPGVGGFFASSEDISGQQFSAAPERQGQPAVCPLSTSAAGPCVILTQSALAKRYLAWRISRCLAGRIGKAG
jgi:hypothetical protein